jgi:hypothetical protein
LDENLKLEKAGLSNTMIQSDPKRAVGFEPESPRASLQEEGLLNLTRGESGDFDPYSDRDATRINIHLTSREEKSAIDVCATPLCLDATNDALDEVNAVFERLHYSTISTILLSRVIKEHYKVSIFAKSLNTN